MRWRVIGLLLLLAILVAGVVVITDDRDDDRIDVALELRDAGGLRTGSLVRVGGAPVGSVRSLEITQRNTARAVLAVERTARPGARARAAVRAANLLGEKFVDLDLGDRARPLEPARIPLARTSTPVEIDDLLDVLDPQTRDRLGILIAEVGVALNRRGRDLRATIAGLPPTIEDAAKLTAQLGQDTDVLERLLVEADRVTGEIARERRRLGQLVTSAAKAFAGPAARSQGLRAALAQTPATLVQLRSTLRRLDAAGADLRPAARGLRTTAPVLTSTLRLLPGFRTSAAPALRSLGTTGPALRRLGRGASPVVRRLRTTSDALADLATDADALLSRVDATFAADLLSVMQGWAQAIQTRDGVGHLFRVSLSLTPDMVRRLDRYVTGTRTAARPAPPEPIAPARADGRVDAAKDEPKKALDDRRSAIKRRVDDATEPVAPVVGEVRETVEGLLQGLFGGAASKADAPAAGKVQLLGEGRG